MTDYTIYTDSTTDMDPVMQKTLGVEIIPLEFTIDGITYQNKPDHSELGIKEFYQMIRDGKVATTSLINTGRYLSIFEPEMKAGKDILYIAFSSGMTGSVVAAFAAVEELSKKYPERKIIVVDSLAASMGECLLVYLAVQKKREGLGIDELAQWVTDNRNKICHYVVADDLQHLRRGGRLSATTAIVGTMLNIKPLIYVNDEGRLISYDKIRGRKVALEKLVDKIEELAVEPGKQVMFISHADSEEDAKTLAAQIKKRYGVKEIHINFIGPVIGAHTGTGTVALFFIGKNK